MTAAEKAARADLRRAVKEVEEKGLDKAVPLYEYLFYERITGVLLREQPHLQALEDRLEWWIEWIAKGIPDSVQKDSDLFQLRQAIGVLRVTVEQHCIQLGLEIGRRMADGGRA
jgi:hypothetical protein